MAGGLAADIAVRVVADIGFNVIAGIRIACVAVLIGADAQTAIAVAITIIDIVFIFFVAAEVVLIGFFVFIFVLPHIIAIAEALDDQTIAIAAAVKLTTPTRGSE